MAKKPTKFEMAMQAVRLAEELKVDPTELPLGRLPTSDDRKEGIETTLALLQQVKATGKSIKVLREETAHQTTAETKAVEASTLAARMEFLQPLVIDTFGGLPLALPSLANPAAPAESGAVPGNDRSPSVASIALGAASPTTNINKMYGMAYAYWEALKERAPGKIPIEIIPFDRAGFGRLLTDVIDKDVKVFEELLALLKKLSDEHAPIADPREVRFLKENLLEAVGKKILFPADVQQVVAAIAAVPSEKERLRMLRRLDRQDAYSIGNAIRLAKGTSVVERLAQGLKQASSATNGTGGGQRSPTTTQRNQSLSGAPNGPEIVNQVNFPPDPGEKNVSTHSTSIRSSQRTTGTTPQGEGTMSADEVSTVGESVRQVRDEAVRAAGGQTPAAVAAPAGQQPTGTVDPAQQVVAPAPIAPPAQEVVGSRNDELLRHLQQENARLQAQRPAPPPRTNVGAAFGVVAMVLLALLAGGVLVERVISLGRNSGATSAQETQQEPSFKGTVPATFDELPPLYPESAQPKSSSPSPRKPTGFET